MSDLAWPPRAAAGLRDRLLSPMTSLVVAGGIVVMTVVGIPLSIRIHELGGFLSSSALFLPFAVVGVLIVRRQPRNPVGWVMLMLNALYTLGGVAGSYAVLAFRFDHPDLPLARLAVALTQCWIALVLLMPLPILLYPDGRVPVGRWRWTVWAYGVVVVVLLTGTTVKDLAAFTANPVLVDSSGELQTFSSSGQQGDPVGGLLLLLYAVISLSWVVRQVIAYRTAVGDRREQLKWLVSGTAAGIVGFTVSIFVNNSTDPVLRLLTFSFVGVAAIPVSIGVGILRYRLYDIDRLVSRTLSYAMLTGLLLGVYFGLVAVTTRVLPLSSPVAVAGSTLAAAALFTPLRRRIQRIVDYRFNRAKYDAEATVASYVLGLREAVNVDRLQEDLVNVIQATVAPINISVWIKSVE